MFRSHSAFAAKIRRIDVIAVTFSLNGEQRTFDVDAEVPLLYVLRNDAELNGAKFGCGLAQCALEPEWEAGCQELSGVAGSRTAVLLALRQHLLWRLSGEPQAAIWVRLSGRAYP